MHQTQNQQMQSPTKVQRDYTLCFRCNKPGHWAKNCPENPSNRSPISQAQPITTSDPKLRSTHCPCGAGLCEIRVSGSVKNPGRKYYRCPGKSWKYCGYFKWCNELREVQEVQPEAYPICGCEAGTCSIRIEEKGPNAGRRYFGCPIAKGDGACNFRQWLDAQSAPSISEDIIAKGNSVQDEFELTDEAAMQIDVLERSVHQLPSVEVHVQMEAHEPLEEVGVQMKDNERDEESDEVGETLAIISEVYPSSLVNNAPENTLDLVVTNQNNNVLQKSSIDENIQASITALVATVGNPQSQVDVILKYLTAHLLQEPGWLGRVAYPCQRVSISAVTSLFCGSFPNSYPITIPEQNASAPLVIPVKESCEEGSPGLGDQSRAITLENPSGNLKDGFHEGHIMTGTILQAFEKLACSFQNDLITLLESMGPQYYKSMVKEAECTFAALDRLQVDYGIFRLRVTEYITQAAALAQIEQIISNDASSQELLKRYNDEKSRFDGISRAYSEALATFIASSERLSLLRENTSCLRDMLVELETELCCCESENAAHRDSLLRISETMSECKNSLQVASREAAEFVKQSEKRQIELSAAKAAYEKAKIQLRG